MFLGQTRRAVSIMVSTYAALDVSTQGSEKVLLPHDILLWVPKCVTYRFVDQSCHGRAFAMKVDQPTQIPKSHEGEKSERKKCSQQCNQVR